MLKIYKNYCNFDNLPNHFIVIFKRLSTCGRCKVYRKKKLIIRYHSTQHKINFISWVKILYTNPIFRIKNNGWISKTCKIIRGIRQGCPISAMLYLFVAEILALKLRENNNIPGVKINYSTEIKTIQHADDITSARRFTQKDPKEPKGTIGARLMHGGDS